MKNYRKVKVVGKGTFGYALLVKNTVDRKYYIMKVIDVSQMDAKQKEEALNEVHVLKAMRHPYIVAYRESFMDRRNLCIVMDYADGGDMYRKIAKQKEAGKGFPESLVLDWFVQICLAIKHIHDHKILHRDLKTQNIFLTSKGEVKIGDFGIARVLQHTYDCAQTAIGTPYYLSPEICQGKPYNQKSDIWSIGCMLYEMVTLRHAFEAKDMKGLVVKILKGNYPAIPSCYSQNLRVLINELLQRDPHLRPSIKKILEKDFIRARITSLLSQTTVQKEFGSSLEEAKQVPLRKLNNYVGETKENKKTDRSLEVAASLRQCLENPKSEEEEECFEEPEHQRLKANFLTPEGAPLPGVSEMDSVFGRIEALRCYLETMLGITKFMQAYEYLSSDADEDHHLKLLLGPEKIKFVPLIGQLIVCEDSCYTSAN